MATKTISFVATDNTDLTAYSSDGISFTEVYKSATGVAKIRSNLVGISYADSVYIARVDGISLVSSATQIIQFNVDNSFYSGCGLFLCWADASNYYSLARHPYFGTVDLYRASGGSYDLLANAGTLTWSNNTTHSVHLGIVNYASANTLTIIVDGSTLATYVDSSALRLPLASAAISVNAGGSGSSIDGTVGSRISQMTWEFTEPEATTYTASADGDTVANWEMPITLTPNGLWGGTLTMTPETTSGMSPVNVILADDSAAQTGILLPAKIGSYQVTFTNTPDTSSGYSAITNPSPITVAVTSVGAHGFALVYNKQKISAATDITIKASQPGGVALVEISTDSFSTVYGSQNTLTNNTMMSNDGVTGIAYDSIEGYTFTVDPADFGASGTVSFAIRVTGNDNQTTSLGSFIATIDKGDLANQIGYVSGATGSPSNSGTSSASARALIMDVSTIFNVTDNVEIKLGAGTLTWGNAESLVNNTNGFLTITPAIGVDPADAAIVCNTTNNTTSPGPDLLLFDGVQFGSGDSTPAPFTRFILNGSASQITVIKDSLALGPVNDGTPYYGLNWSIPDAFGLLQSNVAGPMYSINTTYKGIGAIPYCDFVVGSRVQHSTWGINSLFVVNVSEEHVYRPESADTLPTPGVDVHPDIRFYYTAGVGLPKMFIDGEICMQGPYLTRGNKLNGDGIITDYVIIANSYYGNGLGGGMSETLSVAADATYLENVVSSGDNTFSGTGLPLRGHNVLLRDYSNVQINLTSSQYMTYDEGGRHLFLTCWTDGSVTTECAVAYGSTLALTDATKFVLSGSAAAITDVAFSQTTRRFTYTLDDDIYIGEKPTLTISAGAYTVDGVSNLTHSVSMVLPTNRNFSTALPITITGSDSVAPGSTTTYTVTHADTGTTTLTLTADVGSLAWGGTFSTGVSGLVPLSAAHTGSTIVLNWLMRAAKNYLLWRDETMLVTGTDGPLDTFTDLAVATGFHTYIVKQIGQYEDYGDYSPDAEGSLTISGGTITGSNLVFSGTQTESAFTYTADAATGSATIGASGVASGYTLVAGSKTINVTVGRRTRMTMNFCF